MTSKKIQDATKRLAALADRIKVTNREEYQQKVIKAVRGPLEEAIEALQKPSTVDVDYMVNPNNNTAGAETDDNSAEQMEIDDDDIATIDDTTDMDEDAVDSDHSNVDSDELPQPGDGDILVGDEILYVHKYLGDQWTKMIVSYREIIRLGGLC